MVWLKPRSEVVEHYNNCRSAIEASCRSYDAGNDWEAARLATSIYALIHDGGKNSRSILTQLGLRSTMRFVSYSVPPDKRNLLPSTPLVLTRVGPDGGKHFPVLDQGPRGPKLIQVRTWWELESVFSYQGNLLSRRRLVFSLRSQDGGAHVDRSLTDIEYVSMKHTAPALVFSRPPSPPEIIRGVELATMRHVAFEVLKSLDVMGRVD
jgi:hypothetical protein